MNGAPGLGPDPKESYRVVVVTGCEGSQAGQCRMQTMHASGKQPSSGDLASAGVVGLGVHTMYRDPCRRTNGCH